MKDRIIKLMKSENLSPSQLADNIGVQRSGVSHIISGRNNPGVDFIQRILKYYPNVNPDWLLLNKGPMYRNADEVYETEPENEIDKRQLNIDFNSLTEEKEPVIETPLSVKEPDTVKPDTPVKSVIRSNKETDKILILYKDGSFDIYQ
jgi:transcriptional regulator with XRE-family HTH domain